MTTAEAFLVQSKREYRRLVERLEEEGYEYILADHPDVEEMQRRISNIPDDDLRDELLNRCEEFQNCTGAALAATILATENDVDPFPDGSPVA